MPHATTRRHALRLLAAIPLIAAGGPALARKDALIGRLIDEARALPRVSQRIDFISGKLIGIRYQAHTLIGGPKHPERFVVRDDAFDCVTFCEVVLSAALARDLAEFEAALLRIRYEHGRVKWDERNHYFAEWSRRIVEQNICRPVAMEPSIVIDKTVNWSNQGRRRIKMVAIPRDTFWSNKHLLTPGDVIGFVSLRKNLDFYHTGLVTIGKNDSVILRHASQSRRRVLDEPMDAFFANNGVRLVTLLRAVDGAPVAARP
ncbi:MAG: DUF1460 domain-containing protein [Alphaproteobacteria bacterium]|nr:DUF1460 domain-containing protein [Alphaproteobacteria bacterium]